MENHSKNKRLKLSNGGSIKKSAGNSGPNLPLYQPPAAIGSGARGGTSPTSPRPSASIARPANGNPSLRLTVKAPPSRLREATSGSQTAASIPPNPYADNASDSDATPAPAGRTARSTRNPRTVVEPESEEEDDDDEVEVQMEPDEDEDDEEEDEAEDEIQLNDAEGSDQELEDAEDSEEDAEGEEASDEDMDDADADGEEDDHPPPPIIKTLTGMGRTKPNVTITAPPEGPLQSVEDKEMEMEDEEEEELSELDSAEPDENDEEGVEEEDTSEGDSDSSRGATPDLSKLTRRQRGLYEEPDAGLMALSNEAQKKKHLTAEEHAMRRAEMARRRKNLSEKRNEEEKMSTIDKLLKKPAPKRRTRAEIIAQQQADYMATPGLEDGEEERADPLFSRWVQSKEGSRLGVPDEWIEVDGVVGSVMRAGWKAGWNRGGGNGGARMVEEVA